MIESFKTYRHSNNPKEKELHDKFKDDHIHEPYIDFIIFPPKDDYQNYPIEYLTERDKRVMLSTIQWLGSSVGTSFLRECGFKLEKL